MADELFTPAIILSKNYVFKIERGENQFAIAYVESSNETLTFPIKTKKKSNFIRPVKATIIKPPGRNLYWFPVKYRHYIKDGIDDDPIAWISDDDLKQWRKSVKFMGTYTI